MTIQDLEYLDKTVEQAVRRETEPNVETPSLRKVLEMAAGTTPGPFGFTMPKEIVATGVVEKHNEHRRAQINKYRDDATKMRTKLRGAGIDPLAVITKSAWHKILEESKLFVMTPDRNGYIGIDEGFVNSLRNRARPAKLSGYLTFAAGVLGALLTGSLTWGLNWSTEGWFVIGVFVGITSALVTAVSAMAVETRLETHRYKWLVENFFKTHSWDEVLENLAGKGRQFHRNDYGHSAAVVLPEPPIEVAQIISKLPALIPSGYNGGNGGVHIAAEAGAIRFQHSISKILADARDEMIRQEEQLRYDPIIYIEDHHSSAVAIVAQYGDFPIEREVIDRVVNSEHLL